MDFYTVVLRRSTDYWVAMCLENGIAGQAETPDKAIEKLKEAIASFQSVCQSNDHVHSALVSIDELHEFLTVGHQEPTSQTYELRAVYA
jgi:predicted RNase H-like HicB family nuclease